MRIDIISVIPELISSPFSSSIIKRAIESGVVEVNFHNLRDYSKSKHKKVDDYQYGGGPGMVLMIEPIENCLSQLKSKTTYASGWHLVQRLFYQQAASLQVAVKPVQYLHHLKNDVVLLV